MNSIKKKKTLRDRMVGAYGASGLVLVLYPLIDFLLRPEHWRLELFIFFEAVGILLIILAIKVRMGK